MQSAAKEQLSPLFDLRLRRWRKWNDTQGTKAARQPRPDQASQTANQPVSQSATPRLCLAARRKKIGKMEIEMYKKKQKSSKMN